MLQIRPISDLRKRFSEIEDLIEEGSPVYLTKNGYGCMVLISLEDFMALTENRQKKDAQQEE